MITCKTLLPKLTYNRAALTPWLLVAGLGFFGSGAVAQDDADGLKQAVRIMNTAVTRIEKSALETKTGSEEAFTELASGIEDFNSQIKTLSSGSVSASLNSTLTSRWRIVKAAADTISEAGPEISYIRGIAQDIDNNLASVQQQLSNAISALQSSQTPSPSIAAAQEALWLTEKIARNINKIESHSENTRILSNTLIDDSNAFERNINALMKGDRTMGVPFIGTGRALNAVKSASSLFNPVARAAREVAKAAPAVSKANKSRDTLLTNTTPLIQAVQQLSAASGEQGEHAYDLKTAIGIATAIALLLCLPLLLMYASKGRKLSQNEKGLSDVRRSLKALAAGDLTVKVPEDNSATRDIAREINTVTDRQRDLISNVQDPFGLSVQELGKVSAAIRGQAEKGKVWAGTMLKSTNAASDMLALSEEIKNATSDAARTSERNRQRIERGYELTRDMSRASSDVRQSMQNTSKSAKRQGELIQSVTSAVEYIQALNTKISVVAINTRIEAEKAGEQGRPFLGIAESIADLLREAEEEGRRIISEVKLLQNMSAESLSSMENTVSTVVNILEYVEKLDSSLEEIHSESGAISNSISAAEEGANRSADKAQNLNSSIARISDRSTEVTVMSESAYASISNLQSSMQKVADKLSQIKIQRGYDAPAGSANASSAEADTTAANSDNVKDSISA